MVWIYYWPRHCRRMDCTPGNQLPYPCSDLSHYIQTSNPAQRVPRYPRLRYRRSKLPCSRDRILGWGPCVPIGRERHVDVKKSGKCWKKRQLTSHQHLQCRTRRFRSGTGHYHSYPRKNKRGRPDITEHREQHVVYLILKILSL